MIRLIFVLVTCAACLTPGCSWALDLRGAMPCLNSPGKVIQSQTGLLTVHLACDRVLLEIPPEMLGRDMLASTEFAAVSDRADEVAPGSLAMSTLVRWVETR